MSYTLYVAEDCHDCGSVMDTYQNLNLDFRVINWDLEPHGDAPVELYAFPALFQEQRLIAYGIDIIEVLNRTFRA